jgi:surface protein
MQYMFYGASAFSQTLCWDTSGKAISGMFDNSGGSIGDGSDGSSVCAPSASPSSSSASPSSSSASPSASPSITFKPSATPEALTDSNFQTACDAWVSDSSAATATYGDIKFWDTSAITDMTNAFNGLRNANAASFNDDISGWDTSSVSIMHSVSNESMACCLDTLR